jgi:outer membrane receptor protein involved in Fe transport
MSSTHRWAASRAISPATSPEPRCSWNPLVSPNTNTRVRGLTSADNTRDYFLTDIPWDGFNVGRVDLQRGPNSILFGVGSPGGIINTSTNDADFTDHNTIQNRVGSYGSFRDSVDVNHVLIKDTLAVDFAWVNDEELYQQQPAFNDTTRYYGALRYDPVIFGKDNHTSIRVKYEEGNITSNNPRQIPPEDQITPWFQNSITVGGVTNPGYQKITENQFSLNNRIRSRAGPALPGGSRRPPSAGLFNSAAGTQGRSYWADVINYYEATPVAIQQCRQRADPQRHADHGYRGRGKRGPGPCDHDWWHPVWGRRDRRNLGIQA